MGEVVAFPLSRQKAEISVLAILLFSPTEEDRHLASKLSPDDFQEPQLALIFKAMQSLMNQDEVTDIIMVTSKLEEMGQLEEAGGRVFVMELAMCIYRQEKMAEQVKLLNLTWRAAGSF